MNCIIHIIFMFQMWRKEHGTRFKEQGTGIMSRECIKVDRESSMCNPALSIRHSAFSINLQLKKVPPKRDLIYYGEYWSFNKPLIVYQSPVFYPRSVYRTAYCFQQMEYCIQQPGSFLHIDNHDTR